MPNKGVMKTRGELVPYTCSECGVNNIIYDEESGEIICGGCGFVIASLSMLRFTLIIL